MLRAAFFKFRARGTRAFSPSAHSFFNEEAGSYNETAAKDSWARVLKFFGEQIGAKKAT